MPIDSDQDDRIDIDLSDVELTDELPVLVEPALFESDKRPIVASEDLDAEHTARVLALVSEEAESVEELKKGLEQRTAKIEALECDVERLLSRTREIERLLNDKDTAISSLTGALEAARSALKESRSSEERLAAEVAERDNRIARLLDTSEAQPASTAAELEAAREEIAAARAELESTRAAAAKIEQSLAAKEQALAARDERIRALELELEQRLGTLDEPARNDAPRDTEGPKTLHQADVGPEGGSTPALISLTSEGPRRFALAKGTITIGRSSGCDIQILTHFVSREHARLTVSPRGGVLIEDLGSTNGVFVNAVRVDRQQLHHGDVVTVGESQFRFLETMAH